MLRLASPLLSRSQLSLHLAHQSRPISIPSLFTYSPPSNHSSFVPRSPGQSTFAIGDVHGDLPKLVHALSAASLIAPPAEGTPISEVKWTGGDAILVNTGDILDRGSFECACLALLAGLSRQAVQEGGGVVLLLGNHEVLNTLGLFNYSDKGGNEEFEATFGQFFDSLDGPNPNKADSADSESTQDPSWRIHYAGNQPARWRAYETGGALSSWNCLSEFLLAANVGRSVFVHGGITATHLKEHGGIEKMNRETKEWLERRYEPVMSTEEKLKATVPEIVNCAQARANQIQNTMPEFLGGGSNGGESSPVWMRDLSSPPDAVPKNMTATSIAEASLKEIGNGASRIVVGHTPQRRINQSCDGKVWRIDVGMSAGVSDNMPEVLEIVHGEREDEVFVIQADGERVEGASRMCHDPEDKEDSIKG